MPPINWNDIPIEVLNPSMERQVLHTERMTIARLRIAKGGTVPMHSHENEQVTHVVEGLLLFRTPQGEVRVGNGDFLILPPHFPHGVEAIEDSVALDTFAPRRQDWIEGHDAYLRSGSGAAPEEESA